MRYQSPANRVLPAKQGFKAGIFPGRDVDNRLIFQKQLVAVQGIAQVAFDASVQLGDLVHPWREEAEAVATGRFGFIHRKICQTQQLIRRAAVLGNQGDTNACANQLFHAAHGIGLANLRQQFGATCHNLFLAIQILEDDGEFVSADARGKAVAIESIAQAFGHLTQQHVPGLMPACVVDNLEAVEIE